MLPPGGVHLLASLALSINSHMCQSTVCTSCSHCSSPTTKNKAKAKINSQPLTSSIILFLFLHQIANQWHLTFVEDISTARSKLDYIYYSLLPFSKTLSLIIFKSTQHQISLFYKETSRVLNILQHSGNETWYLHLLRRYKWPNISSFLNKITNRQEMRKRLQICP